MNYISIPLQVGSRMLAPNGQVGTVLNITESETTIAWDKRIIHERPSTTYANEFVDRARRREWLLLNSDNTNFEWVPGTGWTNPQ